MATSEEYFIPRRGTVDKATWEAYVINKKKIDEEHPPTVDKFPYFLQL